MAHLNICLAIPGRFRHQAGHGERSASSTSVAALAKLVAKAQAWSSLGARYGVARFGARASGPHHDHERAGGRAPEDHERRGVSRSRQRLKRRLPDPGHGQAPLPADAPCRPHPRPHAARDGHRPCAAGRLPGDGARRAARRCRHSGRWPSSAWPSGPPRMPGGGRAPAGSRPICPSRIGHQEVDHRGEAVLAILDDGQAVERRHRGGRSPLWHAFGRDCLSRTSQALPACSA